MLCWSCGKEIPDGANRCQFCEAEVESPPSDQEVKAIEDVLADMGPEVMSELQAAFEAAENGEDFVNRIMVGDCPVCASSNTGDCDNDPEIGNICIGRCFDCGQIWCTDCGQVLEKGQTDCPECELDEDEFEVPEPDDSVTMNRYHLLAAEIFGYSFANYQDHLGIGNQRYEELMPQSAKTLERAQREEWSVSKVAQALSVDKKNAEELLQAFERAVEVIDAEDPAESFRNSVRLAIRQALEEGLDDEESIESLVTQICYRASDLSVLLDLEGKPLSRYSRHLRRESDTEYYDGYFDEE